VSIDCGFKVFRQKFNTINMMTEGFSKRDTVMHLQSCVVKPQLVLPASFSAMSGTANFLLKDQQEPSGCGETHARAVEAGAFDQQSASWLALCVEMATKICAVIGNCTIAELVANAPVLEAHTVASYVLELIDTSSKCWNWIGSSNRAPACGFSIPVSGLQVGQHDMPYLHVITDSFGVFGYRPGAARRPITCSTELQALVEGKVWLNSVKTCVGQGIAEFNEWLTNPTSMGLEQPPPGTPDCGSWPPYARAPTMNAVVVVAWCGNEFCKTIYKDEDGKTVSKPESKKKRQKRTLHLRALCHR
jgi:hypothetical protein